MSTLRRLFLFPAAAINVVFVLIPLAFVASYSFLLRGPYGGVTSQPTLENYARGMDSLYAMIFFRTFYLSAAAAILCVLLAFPLAFSIARSGRRRHLLLQLVILPYWTSFLIRTYAWMFLLRDTGLFNTALLSLGLIREPLPLLYNDGAVLLCLVYTHLPLAVLPIYASLEKLDRHLLEAAADLGAKPWQALWTITLPLAAPGLRAAGLLVFIPCLGAYLTSDLLGGGKSVLLGNVIQNQFSTVRDWPFGSALSVVLMVILMVLIVALLGKDGDTERLL